MDHNELIKTVEEQFRLWGIICESQGLIPTVLLAVDHEGVPGRLYVLAPEVTSTQDITGLLAHAAKRYE